MTFGPIPRLPASGSRSIIAGARVRETGSRKACRTAGYASTVRFTVTRVLEFGVDTPMI
jgi:hypothetical protein